MHFFLLYDIPNDRVRTKVADFCLDYGLDRIQYSVFLGKLSRSRQNELMLKIKRKIGKGAATIHLVPVAEPEFHQMLVFKQTEPKPEPALLVPDSADEEEAG